MFDKVLRDVVVSTPGAIGAILLDQEGECVQYWAERVFEIGADGIRAIGAYQGIYLADLRRMCDRAGIGRPERFVTDFAHARVLTYDLKDGYFVVLITDRSANEGVAWHHLRSCRQRLLPEI